MKIDEKALEIICTKCNHKLPASDFTDYEPKVMKPTCNSCCLTNQYEALWRPKGTAQTKECKACKEAKVLEDYYDHKGSADGKHSECKQCMKAKASQRKQIKLKQLEPLGV